jgi:hypothetical protein
VVDAIAATERHELSKHQEHSLRINFIPGMNHTNYLFKDETVSI